MEEETSKLAELYPHSIAVTRGAKGQYGWDIKVRYKGEELDAKKMVQILSEIDKALKENFKDEVKQ